MNATLDIFADPEFLLAVGALVVVLVAGVSIVAWLRRRYWQARETSESAAEERKQYRELYEEGELSEDEYDRICRRLSETDASHDLD